MYLHFYIKVCIILEKVTKLNSLGVGNEKSKNN